MKIAHLTYVNYDEIFAIHKQNFPNDYWSDEVWADLLNDDEAFYFAYCIDKKIAANIFIYANPEGYIKIMNLAVDKEHRGKGLAVELLNFVTTRYRKEGYRKYFGETRKSNIAMQKAFERSGYTFSSIEENMYDKPQEDGIKYQLIEEYH